MEKHRVGKEPIKNCIISMRVTDEEKACLEDLSREAQTTVSIVMREALRNYLPLLSARLEQR